MRGTLEAGVRIGTDERAESLRRHLKGGRAAQAITRICWSFWEFSQMSKQLPCDLRHGAGGGVLAEGGARPPLTEAPSRHPIRRWT